MFRCYHRVMRPQRLKTFIWVLEQACCCHSVLFGANFIFISSTFRYWFFPCPVQTGCSHVPKSVFPPWLKSITLTPARTHNWLSTQSWVPITGETQTWINSRAFCHLEKRIPNLILCMLKPQTLRRRWEAELDLRARENCWKWKPRGIS